MSSAWGKHLRTGRRVLAQSTSFRPCRLCLYRPPAGRFRGVLVLSTLVILRDIGAEEVLEQSTPMSYPTQGSGALTPLGPGWPSARGFCTELSMQGECKNVLSESPLTL